MTNLKHILLIVCFSVSLNLIAQQNLQQKSEEKARQAAQFNKKGQKNDAESNYREAISFNQHNSKANNNLGNLLYDRKSFREALLFYQESSLDKNATKQEKHSSFHNMGNALIEQKQYQQAVEAYKEALRNDPKNDQTRYNLAVAQEFLKKEQEKNQQDKDKNQDKQEENQQEKDKNQDKQDENQQDKDKNQDKQDENQQDKNKNQDKQNENQQNKDNLQGNQENNQEEEKESSGNPQSKGNLSPEQAERILEAMNNYEKKTQEKVNKNKAKGRPVHTKRDW